jgi:outer membrane lipoprotein-sorting protein
VNKLFIAIFLLTLAFPFAHAQGIRDGESLLRAMHARYKTSWYDNVTFTQKSTTYNPDGTSTAETWYEALQLPGKLRIDIGPAANGNGYVLADGNVTILKDGKISDTHPLVNMLLVLGFDAYSQDPKITTDIVKGQGYDLTKLREDTWQGHAVYVVGAQKGDLQSRQFWVEKDTLLFVRVLEPAPQASKDDSKKVAAPKTRDIRFTNYRRLKGAWIAARVEVHVDDKLVFSEEYSDIQADIRLDPAMFDPKQFNSTHWEMQPSK